MELEFDQVVNSFCVPPTPHPVLQTPCIFQSIFKTVQNKIL